MERTSKASAATAFYLTAALNQLFGNVTPQSLWVSEVTPFDFGNAYSFFRYATQTLKIMPTLARSGCRRSSSRIV
jgi:glucose-6-phosphate isomerase